jgi:hypothetical protein
VKKDKFEKLFKEYANGFFLETVSGWETALVEG